MEKLQNNNIILIGFMGAGKTTIGKRLSDHLGYTFLDTDEVIEEAQHRKIADIFQVEGEEYFRELETKILLEYSTKLNNCVLSTGGGMPLKVENQQLMQEMGYIVFLRTGIETSLHRLQKDQTRPLLQGDNLEEKVRTMQTIRNPIYSSLAHATIDTDDLSPREIVERILSLYECDRI